MTQEERNDIKRYFDVVAENLRSDIRAVAEGVAINTESLDRLDDRFGSLEGKVDRLECEFRVFRDETQRNFDELRVFRDETQRNFDELRVFRDETQRSFDELRSAISAVV